MAEGADKTFHLEIITPERLKYTDDVTTAVLPGVLGQMGFLANHAPILALLKPGVLMLRARGQEARMAVGQGFVKMSQNRAVCLVDFAELPDEVNVEAAQRAKAETEKALAGELPAAERASLRNRLAEQLARLEVAKR